MPLLVKVGHGFMPDVGLLEAFAISQVGERAVSPARQVMWRHIERRVRRDRQEAVLS